MVLKGPLASCRMLDGIVIVIEGDDPRPDADFSDVSQWLTE